MCPYGVVIVSNTLGGWYKINTSGVHTSMLQSVNSNGGRDEDEPRGTSLSLSTPTNQRMPHMRTGMVT